MNDNRTTVETIKTYLLNCFLMLLPIMIWNIVFMDKLPQEYQPEIFWKDIPAWLRYAENISRTLIFILALLMPLSISTLTQKRGVILYLGGILLYFVSWLVLMYLPDGNWSNNIFGFMAPAYTPLLWLTGIGLIGSSFYFNLPYRRWFFISTAIIFLVFHNFHTMTIYFRTH